MRQLVQIQAPSKHFAWLVDEGRWQLLSKLLLDEWGKPNVRVFCWRIQSSWNCSQSGQGEFKGFCPLMGVSSVTLTYMRRVVLLMYFIH